MRGKRILYVDDCRMMRAAMTRVLRGIGAICLATGTHDQAVVRLAFEPLIDLAIIDFEMPDGDVSRLIRRLRSQRPSLPLVGTSASDRRSDFAERGVVRFLAKPFGVDDLIRATTSHNTPDDRGSVPVALDSVAAIP
jgi:CheY-like chemotaxis protein